MKQEPITLPEHMGSHPVFLVLCFLLCLSPSCFMNPKLFVSLDCPFVVAFRFSLTFIGKQQTQILI
jgi:hypothetical protein